MKLINILASVPFLALSTDKELCLEVQTCLISAGLLNKADLTGIYNDKTVNALVQLKRNRKLTGGNAIGPTTAKALLAAKPTELVTRKQAEYVYKTKLTDSQFADLNNCLRTFEINIPNRIRHFLSQTAHESGNLKWMKELASGWDYEDRDDLGNGLAAGGKVGDGPKYKGFGALQVTGRYSYQQFSNYVKDPRVMEGVDYASIAFPFSGGGWWWMNNDMNSFIDKGATCRQVSARVNGTDPATGLSDREECYQRALDIIPN